MHIQNSSLGNELFLAKFCASAVIIGQTRQLVQVIQTYGAGLRGHKLKVSKTRQK
jgi:hypothetical protein